MKHFWIVNGILFQISWFSCAYLQSGAIPILLTCLLVHFYFSPSRENDLISLRLCFVGIIIDQTLIILGAFGTNTDSIPLWLMLLWCLLMVSFNHSLQFLQKLPIAMVAIIGAIAGASSYTAALTFGAINSDLSILNFISIFTIIWLVLLPLLVKANTLLINAKQYKV